MYPKAYTIKYDLERMKGYALNVASISLERLLNEIPLAVDQMLSLDDSLKLAPQEIKSFKIIRLLKSYDFLEEAVIEYATGRILSDSIVKRTSPIQSKPDEWVVSRVVDNHWLGDADYRSLIERLRQRYIVDFTENLTSAAFMGAR